MPLIFLELLWCCASDVRHLPLGEDFVARERVRLGVVRGASVGVRGALEGLSVVLVLVVVHVADISVRHVAGQTSLLILDFLGCEHIGVVLGRVFDELLVKHRLKEDVEVAHPPGMVAILVLRVDGQETVPAFLLGGILRLLLAEVGGALDHAEHGQGPEETEHTGLKALSKSRSSTLATWIRQAPRLNFEKRNLHQSRTWQCA